MRGDEERRIWNELFLSEHPRGAGPLVGRQLHYLVHSAHGWLGGLAFAAALQLHARDRWIGWEVEERREHLDRVVGLSRFLIRPMVRCQNLASRVLGLALGQLPGDFEARYAFAPWLVETFVDTAQVAETCFQATNWTRVGTTQGRGRQDRDLMDRNADIFGLFEEWRQDPSVELLVRAQHNRGTTTEKKLFDAVRASEPRRKLELLIGRQSARPKRSRQQARPARKARTADLKLRYQKIELAPPFYHCGKEPIPLWIIHVREEDPPAGVRPIEWFLLTTLELRSRAPGRARTQAQALRRELRARPATACA